MSVVRRDYRPRKGNDKRWAYRSGGALARLALLSVEAVDKLPFDVDTLNPDPKPELDIICRNGDCFEAIKEEQGIDDFLSTMLINKDAIDQTDRSKRWLGQ